MCKAAQERPRGTGPGRAGPPGLSSDPFRGGVTMRNATTLPLSALLLGSLPACSRELKQDIKETVRTAKGDVKETFRDVNQGRKDFIDEMHEQLDNLDAELD